MEPTDRHLIQRKKAFFENTRIENIDMWIRRITIAIEIAEKNKKRSAQIMKEWLDTNNQITSIRTEPTKKRKKSCSKNFRTSRNVKCRKMPSSLQNNPPRVKQNKGKKRNICTETNQSIYNFFHKKRYVNSDKYKSVSTTKKLKIHDLGNNSHKENIRKKIRKTGKELRTKQHENEELYEYYLMCENKFSS